ncbi:hypothetical protein GPALN_009719 [Globodera pallida]|nr:hypothetical protein GPALN_009719 [Globodera pallida]
MSNSIGAVIGGQNEYGNSKSGEELLVELWDLNHNVEAISIDWLAQMVKDVYKWIRQAGGISKWAAEDIKSWAEDLKKQRQAHELPELLAVACRACKLANGYYPRTAQLISILLMLSSSKAGRRGHLQQIATGEGKTAIVALFVVVKALRDRVKIDVLTSSKALARRDAKDLKTFFGMFALTVDDCTGGLSPRYKGCYAADILYGDIGSFQGDILCHEFQSKNVRGTPPRPFECIVIDEVDCMLVDDMMQGKVLMLSFHVPGMEYLEGILMMCWEHFVQFWSDLKRDPEDENILIQQIDGEDYRAEAWQHYENFVRHLETQLTNLINENGGTVNFTLVIPPHLRAFALKQIPKWMSALKKAIKMNENCEYVIREDAGGKKVVVPIDYQNTGTQQRSTSLSDGLHQFLQLKHGLRMDPETLVTSFITNPGFINRYKQIYGLSGTLGSNFEHSFLKEHYNVDITLMPTYKQPQLETMTPIIENDQQSWIDKICESISVQVTLCKRAALIICLTNDKLKQLSTVFKSRHPGSYKYTDDDEHFPTEFVGPMDVIFSTNYAGRGTDIKTNAELEANGGLHVIVTFMPRNSRVERQAFGRTARQGKKGTAQLILNKCDMDRDLFDQNMDILAKRDQLVEQSFEESKNEVLPKLLVKERLFEKFSTFIEEIRKSTTNAVGGNEQILAQIEEHWGFWLREKVEMRDADAPMPLEAVLLSELDAFIVEERRKGSPPPRRPPPAEFRPFGGASLFSSFFAPMMMARALSSSSFRCEAPFLGLNIFTNPSYLVLKGYSLDYKNAIAHLEKAIKLDVHNSGFSALAHYYMALALVKKGDDISVNEREVRAEHQNKAAEHLKKANELINEKLIPWLSRGAIMRPNSAFSQQNVNKVQLLKRLSEQCEKWYNFISECPAGHFCKFNGWIKPDPDKKLPEAEVDEFGKFGVWEFYQLEYAKPPKAWASIGLMAFFGAVQFGIGVWCVCTGNFRLALPFLQSGIRDLVEAARAAIGNTVISWSTFAIDKIRTYGAALAGWTNSLLSTCKDGIGKWLFKCANWLGLAKPLETPTTGKGDFLTKVIVNSELKQFVSEQTRMSMPQLNLVAGLIHQGVAAPLGKDSIQILFEIGDNYFRDTVKEEMSRKIAAVAREVFGDGGDFLKNWAEVGN